ncbi:hybrid sensor histidine kinase/response regulator [Glaciimonas sp. PCH181]|uniref:hybrid sensor histidine kinase/response regulator n=1 Tax=Glaciimonas sp. PCH181 TaxID=2133943 RepID=UPI000D3D7F0E|nr:hybrid sensor histidine kinase/response regulator [Glaciimonas sp. PCH181]PUA18911.1 hybrid sensor histidine kinase/response regulator [Glaciimonas sp. PCH181]
MNNEFPGIAGYAPPAHTTDDRLALYSQEAEQLQRRITELLAQVESLREATKSQNALEDLVLKLQEANQHLVIATFGAQDMQASAEAANLRQADFLSMLAHELRNPLAPIAMAAELLGKITTAHPQLPKLHGIICRQTSHMKHLVDDLLDASRSSSGKITLQKSPLLLSEIIESAVETSQPFIDKRHQHLTLELPATPVVIDGDLVRLAQVFSNLLINAAKFTPEHEKITISARKLGNTIAVSVKDNGMGIAPDIQPFIFDLFTQGYRSLDRAQGGLGIGLSLVRTIVDMHGGSVKVRSAGVGFGSEFIVVLPISSRPLLSEIAAPIGLPSRHCRILIVEDNIDLSETLSDLLTLEGHTVTSMFDGTTGLAMAKVNPYDIIICDIGLPGMDGYEVVKQLHLSSLNPLPCCIALTGYSQQTNRTLAKEAGFAHYLVKPIAIDTLLTLISTVTLN